MDFNKILSNEQDVVNTKIGIFFFKKMISQTNPFIIQYYSDLKRYILSGGKRLRPISLIYAYKGKEGNKFDEISDLCVSVELLHNASLIHDDIIDHDQIRRGQPAFHISSQIWYDYNIEKSNNITRQEDFGIAMGILGGDYLIDLGLEPILNSNFPVESIKKAIFYYQQAFHDLINGVLYETYLQNLPLHSITESNYLEMIAGKTAALFEKSILMGALFGDHSEKDKKHLSQFAISVGKAFQIRDDILGAFGLSKKIGKPTDSDIREGKKTLLTIYAYKKNNQIQKLLGKHEITEKEIEIVKNIFKETNALEKTKQKALMFAEKAKSSLNKITLTKEVKDFFSELINFVQFRDI
ncbi:MAG: polyprenyl synthetase family protein [Candidatus Helarchaeota archaeon]